MSINEEVVKLEEEVEALLAAAKAIPHPKGGYAAELSTAEFVAEVQREALLEEYDKRSGMLMEMLNDRNMENGAFGDY